MTDLDTINKKLDSIQKQLSTLDNKIENFRGYEVLSQKEKEELDKIILDKKNYSYEEVFSEDVQS